MEKARVFYVSKRRSGYSEDLTLSKNLDKLTNYIISKRNDKYKYIKRGDLVTISKTPLENSNLDFFIWDGFVVVNLEEQIIPQDFAVSPDSYGPDYYLGVLPVNGNFYYLCQEYLNQLKDTLVLNSSYTTSKCWNGYYIHKGKYYIVILDSEGEDTSINSVKKKFTRDTMFVINPQEFIIALNPEYSNREDISILY